MKDNLLIVFILISLLAICSCDKMIKIVYRCQIINLMNINTINVLYGVIINQALNENGNHENSK
ncbi:hypothetical protein OA04_32800 [Pectobacterium versatile]|nr:hypothetical protein OA04_32800 [Pectobacterium versatile]